MIIQNKIKSLIDSITSLYLSKGVQPHEIIQAAFDQEYIEFNIKKLPSSLVMTCSFSEEADDKTTSIIKMKYTYSLDEHLVCIEQKINKSSYKKQFDREVEMTGLISRLTTYLKNDLDDKQVAKVLSTLPIDLHKKVTVELSLAA